MVEEKRGLVKYYIVKVRKIIEITGKRQEADVKYK